jgi:hypothetical protein
MQDATPQTTWLVIEDSPTGIGAPMMNEANGRRPILNNKPLPLGSGVV